MGWRFRKYITIFPGVRLNISKSGVSLTFGTKGASVNLGKDGAYLNTSIPGTGLYNRQKNIFTNNMYEVWDLVPRNVLKDNDGDIYVVDAEIKILNND